MGPEERWAALFAAPRVPQPVPEPAAEEADDLAERFFEEEVGPLAAVHRRRLRLLVARYGRKAVVRALAEVLILELNDAVLGLVRDRLRRRFELN